MYAADIRLVASADAVYIFVGNIFICMEDCRNYAIDAVLALRSHSKQNQIIQNGLNGN
jgi:hypothetical protein